MNEPPANEREVAKMLFDAIKEARTLGLYHTPAAGPHPANEDEEDEDLNAAYTGRHAKSSERLAYLVSGDIVFSYLTNRLPETT